MSGQWRELRDDELRALRKLGLLPRDGTERSPPPKRFTPAELPCPYRLAETGRTVDCGCGGGGERAAVYVCAQFDWCTLQSTGKRQRIERQRVAVCLGCAIGKRFAAAT